MKIQYGYEIMCKEWYLIKQEIYGKIRLHGTGQNYSQYGIPS